ncbi:MAG: polysaccharide deacetylase family protein [Sulfurifustaceae bacterium]
MRRPLKRVASYIPRHLIGTVTSVETTEPAIAFTFDDGPHPRQTPQFLDTLESRGARGTFFLLGYMAERYPELVARIRRGGHAIGNHSWNHPSFPAISAAERRRQIRACGRALGEIKPALFRPPYGDQTVLTRLDPLWLGWEVITWSISGTDWRGDGADSIAGRILTCLRPGSIVLLHDALFRYEDVRYTSRDATLKALTVVLDTAASQYRFVTVPELLRLGRPNRELWIQPGQADYLARLKSGET